jgi:hypothetical protein
MRKKISYIPAGSRIFKTLCLFLLIMLPVINGFSQRYENTIKPRFINGSWDAYWINHPEKSPFHYGVFHFRRVFEITEVQDTFLVHVSADNRYKLFVNGEQVCHGPARGDITHWRFETVNLAPYLKQGRNVIAAQVWNYGQYKPVAQFSVKTAFILQGNSDHSDIVNTDAKHWKVLYNKAIQPINITSGTVRGYYAGPPCERIVGKHYPWNWKTLNYEDSHWTKPKTAGWRAFGTTKGYHHFSNGEWKLVPRNIPLLERKKERSAKIVRRSSESIHEGFLSGNKDLVIEPHSRETILLDHKELTRAYPKLTISKGKGSTIELEYAESLRDDQGNKGNREAVNGKKMQNNFYDEFLPDGSNHRQYTTLWYRTYRYLQMEVETGEEPLVIHDFYSVFTAYPFELRASFSADDQQLDKIFDISWHTLRMCTGESFVDCPYYEQLQYAGDTRIQALLSLYLTGDDRLMKNAIELFDVSRTYEGITYSRYPSNIYQFTPAYSLHYVLMIHDHLMYTDDTSFAGNFLNGIKSVLRWYENKIDETGMLGEIPWIKHIEAKSGTPRYPDKGHSAQVSLFYALTLQKAAKVFEYYGKNMSASHYKNLADSLINAVKKHCWDKTRQLFSDRPDKSYYTQHTNTIAVLCDAISPDKQRKLMQKVITDTSLVQSYLFFKFYVFRAMKKAGLGDKYIRQLDHWKHLLDYGFTTWPEFEVESRSDCHGWSSHPGRGLLAYVCGIKSDAAGFKQILIEPGLGPLSKIKGAMPHPRGRIKVELRKTDENGLKGKIHIPGNVSAKLRWGDKTINLKPGSNSIDL